MVMVIGGGQGCSMMMVVAVSRAVRSRSGVCFPPLTSACMRVVPQGSEEQKQELLPKMAKFELVGSWALTEPSNGSDAATLQSTATKVSRECKIRKRASNTNNSQKKPLRRACLQPTKRVSNNNKEG